MMPARLCLPLLMPFLLLMVACSQSIVYTVEKPARNHQYGGVANRQDARHRDGKCFKQCTIPPRYETQIVSLPIYTGAEGEAPLRTETLMVELPRSERQKQADGSIRLIEKPAITQDVCVLADTIFYHDFRYESFLCKKLVDKGGYTRETEVLCSDERTPELFQKISAKLQAAGYLDKSTTQWTIALSLALQRYQQDQGLPVGDLSLETIRAMGI